MESEKVARGADAIREEVAAVVTGYEDTVGDLLLAVLSRGHVLLEGVPGVAKTSLAKAFAAALGVSFHRIQFTQDLLPADITGHYFFNQRTREFELRKGPIFSSLVLADEVNRTPPKTQSALLEAMEERQVTIDGNTFPLPHDFMVIATMNPVDFEGVYRLPEAQLDRFLVRSRMGYLPRQDELRMLEAKLEAGRQPKQAVPDGFPERAREAALRVHVDRSIVDYIHRVCLETRQSEQLVLGASPRAMEHLLMSCRSWALLEGRAFVVPDDVKAIAPRILGHRLLLSADAELAGVTTDVVLEEILARTPPPSIQAAAR